MWNEEALFSRACATWGRRNRRALGRPSRELSGLTDPAHYVLADRDGGVLALFRLTETATGDVGLRMAWEPAS